MTVAAAAPTRLGYERPLLLLRGAVKMIAEGRFEEAETVARRLIAHDPTSAPALSCIGSIRERVGDVGGALDYFRKAHEAQPSNVLVLSNLIFAMDRHVDTTLAEAYALRRRYNDLVVRPAEPHPNDRDPERPLRIGYVSSDFRHHSAAYGFGPVMLKHHKSAFEVFAYSCSPDVDWLTDILRDSLPNWRSCAFLSDDELEAQIRADRIDILVDLSGHSAGNRLPVFARKPAPVQVTAIGYITGTGLDAMDYLLADAETIYPEEEQFYSEKVVRLERLLTYWAADPKGVGPVLPLPAERNGHITYGVFNRLGKLRPACIELWSKILRWVPTSRLILKASGLEEDGQQRRVLALFDQYGGDTDRVELRGGSGHNPHMRDYGDVDVCLDPWPDGGGISTLEAAYMGVPTLTYPWRQISSRVTASVNQEMGLPYLIVGSPEEYVERAIQLNEQRAELADVRWMMRDLVCASAFADHERAIRGFESAYRQMWGIWCKSAA